jgi:pimeloyl-ACP methyl ester carboxylesterase
VPTDAPDRKLQSARHAAQSPRIERVKAETVRVRGAEMAVFDGGNESRLGEPLLVWAHGWGHTHRNMLPLAEAMRRIGRPVLLDLPGFGASPPPPAPWGTEDYADAAAEFLAARPAGRRVWIGHSFGCRVGLQLAARHPGLVDGLFLIAAAGLPRARALPERMRVAARRLAFRAARRLTPEGPRREALRARFGSADYARAGPMRPILVKAVGEDLSAVAGAVGCAVVLLYGDRDDETPPEIGARLNRLMPQSRLIVLRGFDHWNVLTDGRHQVVQRLSEFVEQIV